MRQFVASATALLGQEFRGSLDDVFALAPREASALDHCCQHSPPTTPKCATSYTCNPKRRHGVHLAAPGEPVFNALAAQFIAHTLAIPSQEGDESQRYDERVEDIAVRIATAWERERGATVPDVSKLELARDAGLSNWLGFDLLATQPNGQTRCIEVKAAPARDAIHMETNEWKQTCH